MSYQDLFEGTRRRRGAGVKPVAPPSVECTNLKPVSLERASNFQSSMSIRRDIISAVRDALRSVSQLAESRRLANQMFRNGFGLPQASHVNATLPEVEPVFVHNYPCSCPTLSQPCLDGTSPEDLELSAALELAHNKGPDCHFGAPVHERKGAAACVEFQLWYHKHDSTPVGTTLRREFFSNSPQEHAVLNRHLLDYFNGRRRAQETTPYAIPTSQLHLLQDLGMEMPQPDAPEVPHALHKCIEESQLRRMRNYLQEDNYGLISVKDAKLGLLPKTSDVQYPAHEAKDVSRYPGKAVRSTNLRDQSVYFMHDVSSEVTPHELVERLDKDNPTGHLFVTGMNPHEVLDRVSSFEPASHEIDYDINGFNFIFTGSASESYFTPIDVTVAWLRSSSVRASSGRVYQVVLLDYKLGHCVWHVFAGDVTEQHTRTFGTGSYVRLPAVVTGTWRDEWLPTKLVTGVLAFTTRTPDLSTRNLAAKVAQLATSITPRLTSREQWVATHIAHRRAPIKTWDYVLGRLFWNVLYVLSFQWRLLKTEPDIYSFVDERRRYRTIHPTPGGGWSPAVKSNWKKQSIPNNPTWLQRASAFTSSVFTFVLPKILVGEVISNVVLHVPLWTAIQHLYRWADLQPLRVALTAAIVVVTAILPGHIVKVFSRLSGHFWRQLWLPGWLPCFVERVITEVCGGPGANVLLFKPGRGWFYQAYLWAIGVLSILPGLVPHAILPTAIVTGHWWVPTLWFLLIAAENALPIVAVKPFVPCQNMPYWYFDLGDWLHYQFNETSEPCTTPFIVCLGRSLVKYWPVVKHYGARFVNWLAVRSTSCERDLRSLPAFTNLPVVVRSAPPAVRRNKVDIPLPAVAVQPSSFPVVRSNSPMNVDPQGLTFVEWVSAVEQAYSNHSKKYLPLTPGQSCFWDCVSSFGGSAHMWYSWFMEASGRKEDPSDPVVGNVVMSDMLIFSAMSGFGVRFSGLCQDAVQATRSGWPVIHMTLSHSVVTGLLHVEIARPAPATDSQANLSRILATVRRTWPAWERQFQNRLNASPVDSAVTPTPLLVSWANGLPLPTTRNDVVSALIGSFSAEVVNPSNQGGFAIKFGNYGAPYDALFDYNQPVSGQAIGMTSPKAIWRRFYWGRVKISADDKLNEQTDESSSATTTPTSTASTMVDPVLDLRIGAVRPSAAQAKVNASSAVRPNVARWAKLEADLRNELRDFENVILPDVPLSEEVIMYTADLSRASRLVADLKAKPSVLESFNNPKVLQSLDNIIDLYKLEGKTVTVPVRAYFGIWGCGKTTATINYLKGLDPDVRRQVRVVSHTESLRAASKLSLDFPEMRGFNFPTTASIITEPTTGPVVFDDAGKFWGGLLDLVILANPLLSEVVVNGDPAQGMEKFPVQGTQSEYLESPIAALAPYVTRYATRSHRSFRLLADTMGVYTTNPVQGHITHTNKPMVSIPVCTASPRYAGVLAAGGREAYTYASVQGEDFKTDMEIDMTGLEGSVLDRSAYVALTRSSTGVYIHMDAMDPDSRTAGNPTGSGIMNAILIACREAMTPGLLKPSNLVKSAFYRHLAWSMPSLPWFAKVGATVDPADYQNVFPAVAATACDEGSSADPSCDDFVVQSGPTLDNFVREVHFHAKEDRELPGRSGATDQFKETSFVNPHDHKRKDTATYFLSVQKRLTTQSARGNLQRMLSCPRQDLIDEYDRLVPEPPQLTPAKFEMYCERAIREYESKRGYDTIIAKIRAHDPDRTASDIVISLKNQVIKKDEKRNKREAIPGQLIHEYDLAHTLSDAPYALFLEDEIIPAFPENFLFYRRMNPDTFIREYQKRWRVNNGVHTSDVTRWDVGCDAGMLNFDVHVFRRSSYPADYIQGYIERRLNSRSQHGPMATMQNSGDRYTWPLNSVRRATVASLINHVKPEDTVAINGDDEAMDRCSDSDLFPDSPWEFKNLNGMRGEFSGFELGGPVPEYSARGIQYRTMILESRDPSAQNKWLNYLGLLNHANHETPEAADVAFSAHRHMKADLFAKALPAAMRGLFPNVNFSDVC